MKSVAGRRRGPTDETGHNVTALWLGFQVCEQKVFLSAGQWQALLVYESFFLVSRETAALS